MTKEMFLKELSKIDGWHFAPAPIRGNAIRAMLSAGKRTERPIVCCPITAVYFKKTGKFLPASRYEFAAKELNLTFELALDLTRAADNANLDKRYKSDAGEIYKLRRELLEACKLKPI